MKPFHFRKRKKVPPVTAGAFRTLEELEGRLCKILDERTFQHEGVSFAEADGVMFLCPKCFEVNGGSVGTHSVICWRPRVPQTWNPKPGRWEFEGSSLDDLTLVAGSSSVLLTGGCEAHFYVRRGHIEW